MPITIELEARRGWCDLSGKLRVQHPCIKSQAELLILTDDDSSRLRACDLEPARKAEGVISIEADWEDVSETDVALSFNNTDTCLISGQLGRHDCSFCFRIRIWVRKRRTRRYSRQATALRHRRRTRFVRW